MSENRGNFTGKDNSEGTRPVVDRETQRYANDLRLQLRREVRDKLFLARDITIGLMILVPVVFMALQFFSR